MPLKIRIKFKNLKNARKNLKCHFMNLKCVFNDLKSAITNLEKALKYLKSASFPPAVSLSFSNQEETPLTCHYFTFMFIIFNELFNYKILKSIMKLPVVQYVQNAIPNNRIKKNI